MSIVLVAFHSAPRPDSDHINAEHVLNTEIEAKIKGLPMKILNFRYAQPHDQYFSLVHVLDF